MVKINQIRAFMVSSWNNLIIDYNSWTSVPPLCESGEPKVPGIRDQGKTGGAGVPAGGAGVPARHPHFPPLAKGGQTCRAGTARHLSFFP